MEEKRKRVSTNFVIALAIVSIIGFSVIMLQSLFYINISDYQETLLLVVLGASLMLETTRKELRQIKRKGLDSNNLGKITMLIVGFFAIVAGIFSLPFLLINHPVFLAIKGIISILAIIFIIVETWVTR